MGDAAVNRLVRRIEQGAQSAEIAVRFGAAQACRRGAQAGVPLTSAALGRFQGQVANFAGHLPGEACYRCFVGDAFDADDCDTCAELGVLGAMAGVAGTWSMWVWVTKMCVTVSPRTASSSAALCAASSGPGSTIATLPLPMM